VNVYLTKQIESAIRGLISGALKRSEPLPDFAQQFARAGSFVNEDLTMRERAMYEWGRTMNGKPLTNLLKVVETTRLIFVRYDSQALPTAPRTRYLRDDDALGYYTDKAPAENVKPTCAFAVQETQDIAPVFLAKDQKEWLSALTNQYRTSMLLTLRDDTTEFFMRDWLEGTPQKNARDALLKIIEPLKKKTGDT
ncbi:MAG: hypothetical protein ACHQT8_05130, partial [Chlamydiales bacterium]